jgi:hypothetical protein
LIHSHFLRHIVRNIKEFICVQSLNYQQTISWILSHFCHLKANLTLGKVGDEVGDGPLKLQFPFHYSWLSLIANNFQSSELKFPYL